jgi:intracellular septation protein
MKFLFDLFPVIVFFATYKLAGGGDKGGGCTVTPDTPITHDPILLATGMAILATLLQVSWLLLRRKKVDGMLWVSLVIVTLFGGATLIFRDPTFIQWKPTILYWAFSLVFLVSPFFLGKTLIQTMLQEKISLPGKIWGRLNASWILFFLFMGAVNLAAVHNLSCNAWVNFKFYGFTALMLAFVFAQSVMLAKHVEATEESR